MMNCSRLRIVTSALLFFVFLMTVFNVSAADTTDNKNIAKVEIQHLLEFIEQSTCIFIRNKESHTPSEAVAHITKKYNHFKKKITTAEDFVKYSATGSLISKKPYRIKCPDVAVMEKSSDWLLDELSRFRALRNSSKVK